MDKLLVEEISIHALREEGDDAATLTLKAQIAFLSTPSARRATRHWHIGHRRIRHFYPRPPRGGRLRAQIEKMKKSHFYPRPPRGGRRSPRSRGGARYSISIHALREEGDERTLAHESALRAFLSTPSARRATRRISPQALRFPAFLSTPSARRATDLTTAIKKVVSDFYPRPPRGGRHDVRFEQPSHGLISIHALREEGDCKDLTVILIFLNFYPRPPRGGRRQNTNNYSQVR